MPTIKQKAEFTLLKEEAKKTEDTRYRTYYKVRQYSIIYNKRKKEWGCDCRWFSVMMIDCSHILACKMLEEE